MSRGSDGAAFQRKLADLLEKYDMGIHESRYDSITLVTSWVPDDHSSTATALVTIQGPMGDRMIEAVRRVGEGFSA